MLSVLGLPGLHNFASPPAAEGLVIVAVPESKLKVVIPARSKGVAWEATKSGFFNQDFICKTAFGGAWASEAESWVGG